MLNGVTVLDLSRELAGPYACMLLGDMGARVIKVEPPDSSSERRDPRFFLWNRDKEMVTLDLGCPEGQAVVRQLVSRVDVVVEDWLPAYARSLGLDYDSLSVLSPRLIFCSIPPYPEDGPLRDTPGDTHTVAASMGIMADQGGSGSPAFVYLPLASYGAAFTACFAVSCALFVREMEGRGQKVEVSLLHGAMAMQAASLVSGPNLRSRGSSERQGIRVGIPVYRLFQAQEGWFFLACGNNTFWNKLCIALGHEELVEDERFRDAPWGIPLEHYDGLSDILEPIFLKKPADYWVRFLTEKDIP
ncbi:MAG: CaiB/BaiF CoA transferase family protein, partial [Dehalococcoidia bacterium]